jgi:hypothetical protein
MSTQLRPTSTAGTLRLKRCLECGRPLSDDEQRRGDWWHVACKDPEGYTVRIRLAEEAANQRCAEAYPLVVAEQLELLGVAKGV